MFRLSWLFCLLFVLLVSNAEASESTALSLQQSVTKFQSQDYTVGLLHQSTSGRANVVHVDKEFVSMPPRPGTERNISHIKASLLSLGIFAALVRNLFFVGATATSRNDWVGFVVLLVLYLVEAATCSTRRYLSNIIAPSQVQEYIYQLQQVAPRIRFHLECYHYEDDDGFSYNSSSHRRHENRSSSKRVTHRATDVYEFKRWRDVTKCNEVAESLEYGTSDKATYLKITLSKLVLFMNSMCYQDYQLQHSRFIIREGNRDRYTDSWTTIEVDGYTPKLLAVRTVLGSAAHVRMPIFWFFTLICLTVPYRMWFSRNCDSIDLAITKEVS